MSKCDIRKLAAKRRYRLRNLNDGRPVPPVLHRRGIGHRTLHSGTEDVDLAIACRHGYVHADGDGIGWALLCDNIHALTTRLGGMRHIPGVVVRQVGDTEAAGTAPVEAIDAVLEVLRPYCRRPAARSQNGTSGVTAQNRKSPALAQG